MRPIRVADDDRHTFAVGVWLDQCGFRVALTDGGANGLTAMNDRAFDLMIGDVFLPTMRGFESIRVFHSRAPTVPPIAICGCAFCGPAKSDPFCFGMALSSGASRCLRKPFRPPARPRAIDECMSEVEPRRKHAATLTAVASPTSGISRERKYELRRLRVRND